ncbi:MAG: HD domain-containing protein [Eubacterium sp.]|nr:HD domain-containing protein [Eubacterium sp.]MBQ8981766.1 HD domain-containing protein [Eubacterium sp.]MBR1531288.1 HD domain-containing protein [Eubacterium sp.]
MNFKQLPNGMCDGFVVLRKCEEKKTKNGSTYLDLIIGDKDGEMTAKLWDYNGASGTFEQEMIVKIRGTVEQYNGKDQFRVAQIRPVGDNDEYNLSDLVPSSDVGGEMLFDMMVKKVDAFTNDNLRRIVLEIVNDKKDLMIKYPAALKLHHAMLGGLMYHTMSIVRMAEEMCKIYPTINRELLLSGAILHDVAKTWELEQSKTGLAKGYTTEGELIGHLVKGAMIIDETAKKLGIECEEVTLLEHMIISHHGVPEYGAAVRPMFLEAIVLSMLDDLDATIFEVNHATNKVDAGSFTDRQWALDNRKLYNHGLSDTEHKVNF